MDSFKPTSHPVDPSAGKILTEFPGFIRIYETGKIQRLAGTDFAPPGVDPSTGVQSKDVVISAETKVGARIYIPGHAGKQKLPILIYFHGGGFIIESAYSPTYHRFLNLLVPVADAVVVSVDYRLAPEHLCPTQYNDCWGAIHWVATHAYQSGPEPWLNDYADLGNVFLAGDSAGGNIAHRMAIRVGLEPVEGVGVKGMVLLHPFFWGEERIGREDSHPYLRMAVGPWELMYPDRKGFDDPCINPCADPDFGKLGAPNVLVFVAEKDLLWDRGEYYKQGLCKSGWNGEIEVIGTLGENHVFFLFFPNSENSVELHTIVGKFIEKCKD